MFKRTELLIAVLLYFVTVLLSLGALYVDEPHVDEYLWLKRSKGVLHRLHEAPLNATTHLGHPGVPPALVMAFSQKFFPKVFSLVGLGQVEKLQDVYFSARLGCALIAALSVPLLFLGFRTLIGGKIALIAALLFISDLRFLGYSRLAHLDATLTFLVLACVLSYIHGELRGSLKLKILAGFFWGLCIATKPTTVVLVIFFIAFKILRAIYFNQLKFLNINWSDIWAVVVGHLTFALIYTRLWHHFSDYRERLKIRIPLAGKVYAFGNFLQEHYIISTLIVITLILMTAFYFVKSAQLKNWPQYGKHILLLGTFFFSAIFLVPQVLENIIRFWKWAFSLSGESHKSFGRMVGAPVGGYWLELITVLNEVVLIGLLLGIYFLFKQICSSRIQQHFIVLACAVLAIIWLLILGISSKQSWRYALPVLPAILVLAAFGLQQIIELVGNISCLQKLHFRKLSITLTFFALLFLSFVGTNYISWFGMQASFFNLSSGGIEAAHNRGQVHGFAGQKEVYEFLAGECKNIRLAQGDPTLTLKVALFGSENSFYLIKKHFFTEVDDTCFHFGYFRPQQANYAVQFISHPFLVPDNWQKVFSEKLPDYTMEFQDYPLAQVFRLK